MRSFRATALLTLAVIAGCFGAHDRSRQRSGPIKSVPVSAGVKREVNFDCPEEFGYYPHPTDCTLYYVCVFGGALLESCTGGLMYSHELQTCDWPRNVGCDATGSVIVDDLERLNEREPPQVPPQRPAPRRNTPPPQRVQPNPVVTSRGQPKFTRQEYEKQQQLYAEVDDLPPVEEIENDRQQRVYRGQPSTIGQVQKDRDGYGTQVVSSGRTFNPNIIPSSINQNSKIGSFSFGTQVEEKRTPTITPVPQSYREDKINSVTDFIDLPKDLDITLTKYTDLNENTLSRRKRDTANETIISTTNTSVVTDKILKRVDNDEEMEYVEDDNTDDYTDDNGETDRDKRQVRFYLKNSFRGPGKNWAQLKPVKLSILQPYNYNTNPETSSLRPTQYNNNYKPNSQQDFQGNYFSTVNPLVSYQSESNYNEKPFKASHPDFSQQQLPSINIPTHIITKSPPISTLNQNPYLNYNSGFQQTNQEPYLHSFPTTKQQNGMSYPDSSQLSTYVVTNNPLQVIPLKNPTRYPNNNVKPVESNTEHKHINNNYNVRRPPNEQSSDANENEYDEDVSNEDEEDQDENEEEDGDDKVTNNFKPDFSAFPYDYTHPRNKYSNIENPFARPNFDFDTFLAKLQGNIYTTTSKHKNAQPSKTSSPYQYSSSTPISHVGGHTSTFKYDGVSTPKPFTMPAELNNANLNQNFALPGPKIQTPFQQQLQRPILEQNKNFEEPQHSLSSDSFNRPPHQNGGLPLDSLRPKLQPPNFNDDRQIPLSYNFKTPVDASVRPTYDTKHVTVLHQVSSNTQKPFMSTSGSPVIFTSTLNGRLVSVLPNTGGSEKPYLISTDKPKNSYIIAITQSTPKPTTTLSDNQLSALQNYWKNPTNNGISTESSNRLKYENSHKILNATYTETTKPTPKRKPIPKPSPEMNDYFYDDEDDYYEPVVKPKYMPISEVKPQRPYMAQNYQQYDDISEIHNQSRNKTSSFINPNKYNPIKQDHITKNPNDLSHITKNPYNQAYKPVTNKTPQMVDITNTHLTNQRNRTYHIKKPSHYENSPNTLKPPKYLNQTTLRPYTVRHRLAKPTTPKTLSNTEENKQRGRIRHQNIVAMKLTTPRDSFKQETRFTKTQHDDRTNSIEPTESITPPSYHASPRPKMLYNGSQTYSPDQYDPYYAVYDEDGELYKDTDYVQQYNTGSIRPAVQQTYRGTPPAPPPARRPVDTYTPRPVSSDDYDDALIQGQINTQNQYQIPIRQTTRGEGNELSYEHNLSGVRTTVYEATTPSTTPYTTSTTTTPTTTTTTTTTPRPTTAQFTEAITLSRYSPRSSDENRSPSPVSSSTENSFDESVSLNPSLPLPVINFSSLAKPFQKTDNLSKFNSDLQTTQTVPTYQSKSNLTRTVNRNDAVEIVRPSATQNGKKMISLTTGFSIRMNANDTLHPYTLTLISKPFNNEQVKHNDFETVNPKTIQHQQNHYNTTEDEKDIKEKDKSTITPLYVPSRRKDTSLETSKKDFTYNREHSKKISTLPENTTPSITKATKYFLKSIFKRPATTVSPNVDSKGTFYINAENEASESESQQLYDEPILNFNEYKTEEKFSEPNVSPYKTLNNLRNFYDTGDSGITHDSSSSTTTSTIIAPINLLHSTTEKIVNQYQKPKPSYYLYNVEDDASDDRTTEIFSGSVKNIIKSFFNDLSSTSTSSSPSSIEYSSPSLPSLPKTTEKIVNIGFQKKKKKFAEEKPLRNHYKHLEIITDPAINQYLVPTLDSLVFTSTEKIQENNISSSTASVTTQNRVQPMEQSRSQEQSYNNGELETSVKNDKQRSKFSSLLKSKPKITDSRKYDKIINTNSDKLGDSDENNTSDRNYNDLTENVIGVVENVNAVTESTLNEPDKSGDYDIMTTTLKSTTTERFEKETKPTTKSLSFPTRASRINPAIKLAATSSGGGRRSYQSSSNCSSDNSLQDNPKCNEIKYQRPSSTRGRGSAHYSTSGGGSDTQQLQPNRGTPPTRLRPTLKPSTAIVSKTTETVDIYTYPPNRPSSVYPQPTPDKTAAKCRKDVCLLPDCFCGGKDIPGNLPVSEVPQIVLITFDDAVNDLNKMYYEDLFERGRVNPNGCPITATFFVSHEWTDYSQVQNLYADGHEFASHTISHSFGEQFSQKKWNREVGGQREILSAYGGVKLEDVRGMRAPFLSVGGNKMFKMLYDSNFTYDSSLPVYENKPPSWPYTLDYKLFHDCMIPPCPTKSYPGVWEVPMVMWQDLNGGRCSMGDACANPPEAEGVYKMILKNFDRHYTSNRAPFGLFYHAAWFTQPHHKEGFIMFLDFINQMPDVWIVTNWQALQWVRDPTPISRMNNFQPFQCNYPDRPKKCNNPKVCNLWHKSGVRYMRTCQPCPEIYPWTGKSGIRSSRIDNDHDE